MIKRWLIRSLFLLPLVCVMAVWVGSYWHRVFVDCSAPHHDLSVDAESGYLEFTEFPPTVSRATTEWSWGLTPPAPKLLFGAYDVSQIHVAGFSYSYVESLYGELMIPCWFPTLLLLALNWLVFRKTRPKPEGKAFPIEPASKPGEPKP